MLSVLGLTCRIRSKRSSDLSSCTPFVPPGAAGLPPFHSARLRCCGPPGRAGGGRLRKEHRHGQIHASLQTTCVRTRGCCLHTLPVKHLHFSGSCPSPAYSGSVDTGGARAVCQLEPWFFSTGWVHFGSRRSQPLLGSGGLLCFCLAPHPTPRPSPRVPRLRSGRKVRQGTVARDRKSPKFTKIVFSTNI